MSCSGASGFVQLAIDRETSEQVAIKFIERAGHTSQRIIARELLNHRECAMHPHIIQLKVRTTQTHLSGALLFRQLKTGNISHVLRRLLEARIDGTRW